MIKVRLRDAINGPVIWEFNVDQKPTSGLDLRYKGCVYYHRETYHEARDSGCDAVVYANLDTICEYIYKDTIK